MKSGHVHVQCFKMSRCFKWVGIFACLCWNDPAFLHLSFMGNLPGKHFCLDIWNTTWWWFGYLVVVIWYNICSVQSHFLHFYPTKIPVCGAIFFWCVKTSSFETAASTFWGSRTLQLSNIIRANMWNLKPWCAYRRFNCLKAIPQIPTTSPTTKINPRFWGSFGVFLLVFSDQLNHTTPPKATFTSRNKALIRPY